MQELAQAAVEASCSVYVVVVVVNRVWIVHGW